MARRRRRFVARACSGQVRTARGRRPSAACDKEPGSYKMPTRFEMPPFPLKDLQRPITPGSRAERFKQGKDLRRKTPREAHAELKGSMPRSAVAILAESDPERVPEL